MINAAASALYSAQITFLWETGKAAKGKFWSFEGPALMRTAVSIYLTLAELEKKGFLTLTVPRSRPTISPSFKPNKSKSKFHRAHPPCRALKACTPRFPQPHLPEKSPLPGARRIGIPGKRKRLASRKSHRLL